MELQTSGQFYNGENNSKSIKVIIEENLRDKDIFLDFETADGRKYRSEKLTLDENGECDYFVPGPILTGEGQGLVQIIATKNDFTEKSKLYKFNILKSINATQGLETIYITENGVYDVEPYSKAVVQLADKTDALLNGTVTNILSTVDLIKPYACAYMTNVESIRLPNIREVPNGAFRDCPNLKILELGPLKKDIGAYAFYNCSSLETELDFSKVKRFNNSCFYNMKQQRLYVPLGDAGREGQWYNGVGGGFWEACRYFQGEEINLPSLTLTGWDEDTSYAWYCFSDCPNLKRLIVPKMLRLAYSSCQNNPVLEYADLGNTTRIGSNTFLNCYSLKAVVLRDASHVTSLVYYNAFDGCCHFKGITNATYNPNGDKDGYFYVPDELVEKYKTSTNWTSYATQIKGISELPDEYKEYFNNALLPEEEV